MLPSTIAPQRLYSIYSLTSIVLPFTLYATDAAPKALLSLGTGMAHGGKILLASSFIRSHGSEYQFVRYSRNMKTCE